MAKRMFDIACVVFFGAPIVAICIVVALATKLSSTGPALHWSRRVGVRGREFLMPKFRTMRTDTPELPTHLLSNPEFWITPVGYFLRKSSLDELPQLWSVLLGDMSIVGPRPALHNQADLISARQQHGVDKLRPGITGWAQVNGRDELSIPAKVEFDYQYLTRQSLLFDLKIIVLTVRNVLASKGIVH